MMNRFPKRLFPVILVLLFAASVSVRASEPATEFGPGRRVLLDAHNCYPYQGRWNDRLGRALSTGVPIAIEQDLIWRAESLTGGGTGKARSIVSHGEPFTGREPTLEEHFFERIRPIIEEALAGADRRDWPLITLNIDFKDNETAHLREIRSLFEKFSAWISWAEKMADATQVSPIRVRPLLVLVGGSGAQRRVFHDEVRTGDRIRAFGAARTSAISDDDLSREERAELRVSTPTGQILSVPADNWRRWWNNSWHMVEVGGAPAARDWTAQDAQRLADLVTHAHTLGYWIRFYTLNGHAPSEGQGWSAGYNLGSLDAAQLRWRAAREAGVDFMASDQYEQAAEILRGEP